MEFAAMKLIEDIASSNPFFPKENENLLQQKGMAIWLTGLSGSGKSTIALLLEKKLTEENYFVVVLDGDELRKTLNKDLGYSEADRTENIRRAAELTNLLVQKNIVVICSFITPLQQLRALAASITGDAYYEVFVDCPLQVCEERDVKGLYKKARNNEISDFTGIGAAFEPAVYAQLTVHTDNETAYLSMEKVYSHILPLIQAGSQNMHVL